MTSENQPLEIEVAQRIYFIRGLKVMLDSDLAELYQVPVKRLNEQVRRNIARFPPDFMFQLIETEWEILRSQIATLRSGDHLEQKYDKQFKAVFDALRRLMASPPPKRIFGLGKKDT